MSLDYPAALEYLAERGKEMPAPAEPRRKFSLDHIRLLLAALGHPQQRFRSVLIAGTNGKGSTAATLASIAAAAGISTGLYTSPHLLEVNERIKVARIPLSQGEVAKGEGSQREGFANIADEDFATALSQVAAASDKLVQDGALPALPSFFELLTACAFLHFARVGVELAVLEVGLGGRLDATNVVEPILSVITDIALDHQEYLGDTLTLIAREKAGILRTDGVLVTLSQHPDANAAIGEVAMALGVRGVDAARFLPPRELCAVQVPLPLAAPQRGIQPAAMALPRNRYDVALDGQVLHIDSPLAGQHQQRNIALAVAAAVELRTNHGLTQISNAAIENGVRETSWPGRLELVHAADAATAPLLLDVAHNPAGAWTLRAALAQLPEAAPRTLIFSCLRDKPVQELAQVLFPLFDASSGDPLRAGDHIVLAPIQNARAASVDELLAAAHTLGIAAHAAPHLPAALEQARRITPPTGLIVATGSVFLVGELRALALARKA